MSKDGHGIEKGDDAEKRVDGLVQKTVAGLSFTLLTLGVFLAALVYWERKNGTSVISPAAIRNRCQLLYNLLLNKYYLDQFNQAVLTKSVQRIGQSAALCDFEGFRK
jgi:NADH:ubiquinone oxidoreductase subunit 5 (subunit L)/multisubunit Na+/H+ antiporter MnhA subunit